MKQLSVHEFSGGVDADSDVLDVSPNNYIASLNIINKYGHVTIMKGNEEIPYTQPAGTINVLDGMRRSCVTL